MADSSCFENRSSPPALGLYVHVPFCVRKCIYCSFYSLAGAGQWHGRYVQAVLTQLRQAAALEECRNYRVRSVFFGGGTPTVLPVSELERLLVRCCAAFDLEPGSVETSIEVNPATVDRQGFHRLRRAGFNRVSIGIQSLDARELKILGRVHTAAQAETTVRQAREAGFSNLSLDLMYGLPGQDLYHWQQTLESALALEPDHLSIYELTLEPGTPLAAQVKEGALSLPGEETILAMLELTGQMLTSQGLRRYEISNYARPGFTCCHNINYWHNGAYLGFGPAAVSCLAGRRWTNIADLERFCTLAEQGRPVQAEQEELDREARFRETVVMGLRMLAGVSIGKLETRFGINALTYYGDLLGRLVQEELLVLEGDALRLGDRGLLLANTVMAELV